MVGTTISQYKILEKLGSGGMGDVYLAEDTQLKRKVAIKFLRDFEEGSLKKKRFRREARTSAALDHTNIATIYEMGEYDGKAFIAMAYVDGISLKKMILSEQLNFETIISIAYQIGQGLKEAHDKGVVHRDIKSSNIMVTSEGRVKITDFGLAKFKDAKGITQSESQIGTAGYMSPEQIRGEQVDHRSDIFSLGVVLYEMITGHLPFKGDNAHTMMFSIVTDLPVSMDQYRKDIPDDLAKVVHRSLEKDKQERYQDIEEVLFELYEMNDASPLMAEHQNNTISKRKNDKYRRKLLMWSSFVLLISLGVFGFLKYGRPTVRAKQRLVILPFENQSGEENLDYLESAIPNLLITNLEQSHSLAVVTWERLHDLMKGLGIKDAQVSEITKEMGFQICQDHGIQEIVFGTFTKAGDVYATEIKVLDAITKTILRSGNSRGRGINSLLEYQVDDLCEPIYIDDEVKTEQDLRDQFHISDVTTNSIEAFQYFQKGKNEVIYRYPESACRFLKQAIAIDSTFAMAHFYLAESYYFLNEYKSLNESIVKAKRYASKATEKERLCIEAMYARYIELNNDKMINHLQRLIKKYPFEKWAHDQLAGYYMRTEAYSQAIAGFEKVLALDPYDGLAYNRLALCYSYIGKYTKALENFEKYASVSPGEANPFDSMGECYLRMGNLELAKKKYKEAVQVRPDFHYAYRTIAYIYALQENYTEAMKWIEQLIQVAPSNANLAWGYSWKGFLEWWCGKGEQAVQTLSVAEGVLENTGDLTNLSHCYKLRSNFLYNLKLFEEGKHYLSQWLKLRRERFPGGIPVSDRVFYHFMEGWRNIQQTHMDSARIRLNYIKDLLDTKSRYLNLQQFRSDLLAAENFIANDNPDDAIHLWNNGNSFEMPQIGIWYLLFYNVAFPYDVLARAYVQKGDIDMAIAEYENLISINPDNEDRRLIYPIYHYRLAKLYEEQNKLREAKDQFEQFLSIWKDADNDLLPKRDAETRLSNIQRKLSHE